MTDAEIRKLVDGRSRMDGCGVFVISAVLLLLIMMVLVVLDKFDHRIKALEKALPTVTAPAPP